MKCNFERWPLLTRSLYGYGKEINITPFQLLSQLSDSRYFSLCKCAPLLAHSFFLRMNGGKKKTKVLSPISFQRKLMGDSTGRI